ncbi:hypothetical protein AK95_30300 [Paenibacillus sp. LC231]|uniref:hypothetical protein n=1 Tax=Paenibacillus sp. LC231 TaxID=1120679 RepID=UPI0008DD58CF|nr:hypothetical protein [Paenibacillus sp. LC231]OIB02467.1 hypothetical protein AK95_30300 [Paenibacillus sp. LC231]
MTTALQQTNVQQFALASILVPSIYDDFGEHLGMVAVSSAAGIGDRKVVVLEAINRIMNDANKMMRTNVVLRLH